MVEAEGIACVLVVYFVLSAPERKLLGNNSLFVGQL